jgi:cAMP-dependent protein kinase regulator
MGDIKQTIARLKEEGTADIGRGDLAKALKSFQEVLKAAPDDLYALLKAGDTSVKLGKNEEACRYYDRLVTCYSREGFIVKAVALNKLILKVKPDFPGGKERMETLLAHKEGQVTAAAAMAEAKKTGRKEYPKSFLFSDLTPEEFVAVTDRLTPQEVPAGGFIIREGDAGDSIFIIVSGSVSIVRKDEKGREVTIADLPEGSFFGEFGYFSGQKRMASVKAETECVLLEFSRKSIDAVIGKHPHVKDVLMTFYRERVIDTLLAMSPLFAALSAEERMRMIAAVVFSSCRGGTRIIGEGEPGDRMYVIVSGEVEVTTGEGPAVIPLARLVSGDLFGEVAVITGRPRTATVTAITDDTLGEISAGVVRETLLDCPEVERRLSTYVGMRVENTISAIMQYKKMKQESGLV